MRPTNLIVSFVVAMTLGGSVALGCSCARPESPLVEFEESDAVFVGRVTSIETVKPNNWWITRQWRRLVEEDDYREGYRDHQLVVRFTVLENLRGNSAESVVVRTATSGAACGYPHFKEGREFVVYGHRAEDDNLYAHLCSWTSLVEDAKDQLEALRRHASRVSAAV